MLRAVVLGLGGLGLLAGLNGALMLLGLPAPIEGGQLPAAHGPVLVLGFVGTVVALERAVALRRRWAMVAPALLGAGGISAVVPAGGHLGPTLALMGGAALVAVYAALWRRQESDALAVQVLGAVAAVGAALLWRAGAPMPAVVPWFAAFVVLTIAGERVELARLAISPTQARVATAWSVVLLAGVAGATMWPGPGHAALGSGVLALVAWLLRHDVARRTASAVGLPRYVAWSLLAGYGWLAVAGAIWLLGGAATDGPAYDAVVHAVFLGFTLAMIMAHAPVILPAVLRTRLPYRRAFWAPVLLLHASLALRLLVGDGHGLAWARTAGGVANVAAVLVFVALAGWSGLRAHREDRDDRADREQGTGRRGDPGHAGRVAAEAELPA